MLHLSLHEVLAEARGQTQEQAIRDQRNPVDFSMVIAHESHVPKEAPKTIPSVKSADADHQALELAVSLDPGVGCEGQGIEVLHAQGFVDLEDDHTEERLDSAAIYAPDLLVVGDIAKTVWLA